MTNELVTTPQINVDFEPSRIIIKNAELLDQMVSKTVDYYSKQVYTDETVSEAKKAKADLNNVVKVLDTERKKVKKEYNAPFEEFEKKINGYKKQILAVSDSINKGVSAFEESEKQKRFEKINETIAEVAPSYEIDPNEILIRDSWLNKGSFTAKGELTKKTLEEITYEMKTIKDRENKIAADKKIVENYAKAVGLEADSWVMQVEMGSTAPELIESIDRAVKNKKLRELEEEQSRQAQAAYDKAIANIRKQETSTGTVNVDNETGEIIEDEPEETIVEPKQTYVLKLTGTVDQLTELNEFIKSKGIVVEVM